MQPLITIAVTCFNSEGTISRAINSALEQDWPNKEIVIVNDASTDNSLEVIKQSTRGLPNVKVINHEKNKGYPGSLNTLLKNSTGEFIAFFDDDDVSRKDRLTLQWRRLVGYERQNDVAHVFCYSNRNVVKRNETETSFQTLAIGRKAPEPYGELVSDFLLSLIESPHYVWGQFGSCTLMVRRHVLQSLKGFDEGFRRSAEWDLAIRAAFEGAHFIAVDEALIKQYLTVGEGSEKSGKTPLKYALKLRKKHKKYLLRKRSYWASIFQAHARFHFSRKEMWWSRVYTIFACVSAPTTVLVHVIRKKIQGHV